MRRILLPSALLTAALLLTGCSANSGASDEAGPPIPAQPAPEFAGDGAGGAESGGDSSAQSDADRDVIVTGSMTVTADDPIAASRDAAAIVERAGGRIDGRTEYAPANGDAGSATLTLRIPADRLQDVLDELAELGRADEISTSSTDVTVESQDLEARIAALRATIDRLTALLAQASSIEDLITLETRIGEKQAELESLEAQQRLLEDQVAMSTITLYLRSEAEAPTPEPGDFWSGLQTGWGAFVAFWSGLLVALGVLLPWIVVAAVVAAVVVVLVRRRRRSTAPATVEERPAATVEEQSAAVDDRPGGTR